MAFDSLPITIRQAAPGDESHDARPIEEQNRCTVATKRASDGSERCFVHIFY